MPLRFRHVILVAAALSVAVPVYLALRSKAPMRVSTDNFPQPVRFENSFDPANPTPGELGEPLAISDEMAGVVRFNREKAFDGINVLTNWTDAHGCNTFENDGSGSRNLPGSFCNFIPGIGAVSIQHSKTKMIFFDDAFKILWEKPLNLMHHDLAVSPQRQEIFVLDNRIDKNMVPGLTVVSDTVIGLNFKGEEIFRWNSFENIAHIVDLWGVNTLMYVPPGEDPHKFMVSHFNSLQILPAGYEHLGPGFIEGNLLMADPNFNAVFILDRKSKRIVWSYREEGFSDGVHSPRLTRDGKIVYFKNSFHTPWAEIVLLDPKTGKLVWSYKSRHEYRFFSKRFGHVEELPNGNFLVTDNPDNRGRAFEITRDKEIVWEWVSPYRDKSGKPLETYQVKRISRSDFADFTY